METRKTSGELFGEPLAAPAPDGGVEVDRETGEVLRSENDESPASDAADDGRGEKKKRSRRGKEEMAAARQQEVDAIREEFFKELQAKGLIRREDELSDAENPNLELYNRLRKVPDYACKPITDGPLQGKTDINPMLRVKQLTALFGPVGRGFYTRVTEREVITDKLGRQMVHVAVDLYVKYEDGWSQPIQGIGGSPLMSRTGSLDDDAFKKAETDAISVACKKLGMCADVYFAADASYGTKYEGAHPQEVTKPTKEEIEKVAGTLSSMTPATRPAAEPSRESPERKEEAPAAEAKPAPAPAAAPRTAPAAAPAAPAARPGGLSGKSPAPGTLPELVNGSRTWWVIVTYISTLSDKSEAKLAKVKEGYRARLSFSDDLWAELLKTAGITA